MWCCLEEHIATQNIPAPVDIVTEEFRALPSQAAVKQQAQEARLADSYASLMQPLLTQASRATHASHEVIGESEVGRQPIHRICCRSVGGEAFRVLVVAGIHAREWQAVLVVHKLLERLLADPGCCGLATRVDIVPMAKPDGYELSLRHRGWRGNGNHVDLNRNFRRGFGKRASTLQSSQNYRGREAESEAETQALEAMLAAGGYGLVIDVHSAADKLYAMSTAIDAVGGKAQRGESERRRLCKALSETLQLSAIVLW